jgi:hypothetical protein
MTRPIAAILALLLAFLVAACGGSGQGTSTQEGQTTTAKRPSHYEGGEQSVEGFGSEAEGSRKEAILAVEHAYLTAIAEKDFGQACSHLSASVSRSLERVASGQLKARGCPAILPKLLASSAFATVRRQAAGEVKRVRVKGSQAFVVFHAPGARLYVLSLVREAGKWKAQTIAASILVPYPAIGE